MWRLEQPTGCNRKGREQEIAYQCPWYWGGGVTQETRQGPECVRDARRSVKGGMERFKDLLCGGMNKADKGSGLDHL